MGYLPTKEIAKTQFIIINNSKTKTMIINRVQLTGNLGSAPEIRTFDSGDKIAKFSLATNEKYTNRNGEQMTDTQWHHVVAKSKAMVQKAESLEKGSYISIEGRLTNRSYTDKEGNKKYVTEIVATDIVVHQKEGE
jgi:single-strand DNA-binding protein